MGQQMMDMIKESRAVNSGTAMPAGDKQHPFSVKKVPLRDLPNEARNIISEPHGSSPLPKERRPTADTNETRSIITKLPGSSPMSKDRAPNVDNVKLSGTKRHQPDSPSSASTLQPTGNSGANGHLVYVRRKLETEPGKASHSNNANNAESPDPKKHDNNGIKEAKVHQMPMQEPKSVPPVCAPIPVFSQTTQEPKAISPVCAPVPAAPRTTPSEGISLADIVGKPIAGFAATELKSMVTTIPVQADQQSSGNLGWKERFLRLQMFLKSCDQTSQEEYIMKLRTLSAAGRSKHAVELEKRALQLLVEEGRELQRMKVLNVLGTSLPKDTASLAAQISPLQALLQRENTAIDAAKLPSIRNG